jgi:archaellum component FlaC
MMEKFIEKQEKVSNDLSTRMDLLATQNKMLKSQFTQFTQEFNTFSKGKANSLVYWR